MVKAFDCIVQNHCFDSGYSVMFLSIRFEEIFFLNTILFLWICSFGVLKFSLIYPWQDSVKKLEQALFKLNLFLDSATELCRPNLPPFIKYEQITCNFDMSAVQGSKISLKSLQKYL